MEKIKEILLSNRFKSFYWRAGMMLLALIIDFVISNLASFQLPAEITVLLGLVLGEISKYINQHYGMEIKGRLGLLE